jgi:Uncharacterized protein conserved in bacteria (DUF2255)
MSSWNEDDLRAIAESHDLYISPFREDGITYGTPTLVWPLVVDGEVYVRAAPASVGPITQGSRASPAVAVEIDRILAAAAATRHRGSWVSGGHVASGSTARDPAHSASSREGPPLIRSGTHQCGGSDDRDQHG